jgi:hypothetical protein
LPAPEFLFILKTEGISFRLFIYQGDDDRIRFVNPRDETNVPGLQFDDLWPALVGYYLDGYLRHWLFAADSAQRLLVVCPVGTGNRHGSRYPNR